MRDTTMMIALLAAVLAVPATRANAEEEILNDTEYTADEQSPGTVPDTTPGTVEEETVYEGEEISPSGSPSASNDEAEMTDEIGEAGTADETVTVTRREEREISRGPLKDESFGIKPLVGVVAFDEAATGDDTSRGAVGLLFDWNFLSGTHAFFGPQFGGIYSHLGSPGSNFFGSDGGAAQTGANLLQLPANLKLGANIGDRFRVALHGGANFVYRSINASMNLGRDADNTLSDNWSVFPNLGGDVEFGLGKSVSLMLRPDWTFTPGDDFFTGSVSLGIPLG